MQLSKCTNDSKSNGSSKSDNIWRIVVLLDTVPQLRRPFEHYPTRVADMEVNWRLASIMMTKNQISTNWVEWNQRSLTKPYGWDVEIVKTMILYENDSDKSNYYDNSNKKNASSSYTTKSTTF